MDADTFFNKVLPITFILFGIGVLTFVVFDIDSRKELIEKPLVVETNFNGRDFLLTGGSSKPETIEELRIELQRLNWLHNGGSNI
jgi:hypothetical protein